jgi:hypothetical protein
MSFRSIRIRLTESSMSSYGLPLRSLARTGVALGALAGGLALAPAAASAQPACANGTFASYAALGAGGCTVGGVTFAGFSLLENEAPGATLLLPYTEVVGGFTRIGFELLFNPPLLSQSTGSPTNPSTPADVTQRFTVSAAGATVNGFFADLASSGYSFFGPGYSVSNQVEVANTLAPAGQNRVASTQFAIGDTPPVFSHTECVAGVCTSTPSYDLGGRAALQTAAGFAALSVEARSQILPSGSSSGNAFGQISSHRFGVTAGGTAIVTPEPGSVILLGSGVLGLGGVLVRRRRGVLAAAE